MACPHDWRSLEDEGRRAALPRGLAALAAGRGHAAAFALLAGLLAYIAGLAGLRGEPGESAGI